MHCAGRIDLETLQSAFQSEAYIPSLELGSDGWPEARRRQLLKRFLAQKNIAYTEIQEIRKGKYRNTRIRVPGSGTGESLIITLSLTPTQEIAPRQRACDQKLMRAVAGLPDILAGRRSIEFAVTETCSDLTGHMAAPE
jgi:hypothetical protein